MAVPLVPGAEAKPTVRVLSGGPDYRTAVDHLKEADPVLGRLIRQIGPCRLEVETRMTPFAALLEAIVTMGWGRVVTCPRFP